MQRANLKFVEVVDVKQHMVVGMLCDVTLKAKDGERVNFYKAKILVRPSLNKVELPKFKLVEGCIYRFSLACFPVDPPNGLPRHAVNRYNKKENANLKFVKCLHFKRYFVAGELYHITLEAKDGEKVNVYKAEVRERLYQQKGFLLTEFKLADDAPSDDSEKFPEFKSVSSSIFLNLKAKVASIWALGFSQVEKSHKDLTTSTVCAPGFSQVEQSHKDLTTSTVVKKLNPFDPPTTDNLARFAVDLHNIEHKEVLFL
ncbi:putative Cystatin domain-containing protein [Medicago truncatula]|uniref:Cysteine proteinase inhibitor n=1 Tax=Medicago truncatula TaxID=3880 RepID=A0A396IMI0_MEDTR|nr:putative Cystatin domain-containing protein [Medicago truncatula]